jgi:hypothetical protein
METLCNDLATNSSTAQHPTMIMITGNITLGELEGTQRRQGNILFFNLSALPRR